VPSGLYARLCHAFSSYSIYADDILLFAPSIRELQHLLQICESELIYLDIFINVKNIAVYVLGLEIELHVPHAAYVLFHCRG